MTNYAEINMAVKAMKNGAFDYVSKPFQPETILQTIQNALNQMDVKKEEPTSKVNSPKPTRQKSDLSSEFVRGVSYPARKLNDYIDLVSATNIPVLILG